MVEVAVVLPAYNEAKRLKNAVSQSIEYLNKITDHFEIIITEDGSTDGTDKIAESLTKKHPFVKHLHSDERLGRGEALKRAFLSTDAEILVYYDVDLSIDLKYLKPLVDAIRNGFDISTGSRILKTSDVKRPLKREFASRGFNFLVRFLLGSKIHDHQCGFKAFKRRSILPLVGEVKDNHWFWDTEILVIAQKKGMKVNEFPVNWKHGGVSKVDFKRDVIDRCSNILKRRFEFSSKSIYVMFLSSFLILALILLYAGVKDVLGFIVGVNLFILFISAIIYSLSWIFRGLRYEKIVGFITKRKLGVIFMTGTIAISQTLNLILPARAGDLVRAYILKRKKEIPYITGISSLVAERVFDIIAVFLLSLISFTYVVSLKVPNEITTTMLIIGILIVAFFAFLLLFKSKRVEWLNKIIEEIKMVSTSPALFIYLLVLSAAIWMIDVFTCYVVSISLGLKIPLLLIVFAVMIGNLTKILPITPGGIGTYEAAVTAILSLILITPAQAFSIAFLDHIIKNIVTVIFGSVYISAFGLKIQEVRKYATKHQ